MGHSCVGTGFVVVVVGFFLGFSSEDVGEGDGGKVWVVVVVGLGEGEDGVEGRERVWGF